MSKKRSNTPNYRVNERIKAKMVRLVFDDGEHVGIVPRDEALKQARERGELVRISQSHLEAAVETRRERKASSEEGGYL